MEKWLGGKKVRLLVKDRNEYLQKYWVRGDIYEYDLYGSDPVRRAAGWLFDRVSQRVRHVRRRGMLSYIQESYRGGTFIDVGSCIGNHTVFFAVGCPADLVLSFEPVPELHRHQQEILELNGLTNVKLFNFALGDAAGKVKIKKSDFTKNVGMSTIGKDVAGGQEIEVRTLDSVTKDMDLGNVRLVKIDVEGFNVPFLRGASETLVKYGPDIFCECETTAALDDVERYLRTLDYVRSREIVFNLTPTYLFQRKLPAR